MPAKKLSQKLSIDLNKLSWDEFHSLSLTDKSAFFKNGSRIFDCLFAGQFDKDILNELFKLADKIRAKAQTKRGLDKLQQLLSHKRACLYFAQPSTRTFLSFQNACQILGIKTSDIRSISASSEAKGESLEDTIRTMHSYADLIIMRHSNPYIAEKAAWIINRTDRPVPVINAGSGPQEHPTQALLDVYTIKRAFGKCNDKTIAMIGDLKRGRTIRSLTYLLNNYKNIHINYISTDSFKIPDDLIQFLDRSNISYSQSDNIESIKGSDIVYLTRIQDEYDVNNESKLVDHSHYWLKKEHLSLLKKDSIILHPLPRRNELPEEIDGDLRALYWKQERNGMWIRTALLAYIFKVDKAI